MPINIDKYGISPPGQLNIDGYGRHEDDPDVSALLAEGDALQDSVYSVLIQTGMGDFVKPSSTRVDPLSIWAEAIGPQGDVPSGVDLSGLMQGLTEPTAGDLPISTTAVAPSAKLGEGRQPTFASETLKNLPESIKNTALAAITPLVSPTGKPQGKEMLLGLYNLGTELYSQPVETISQYPMEILTLGLGMFVGGKWAVGKIKGLGPKPPVKLGLKEIIAMSDDEIRAVGVMNMDEGFVKAVGDKAMAENWLRTAPIEEVNFVASGGKTGRIPRLSMANHEMYMRKEVGSVIFEQPEALAQAPFAGEAKVGFRVPVPDFFKKYTGYKDVQTLTRPVHYWAAEMDGALPVGAKLNFPNQMGPVEYHVKFRTQKMLQNGAGWSAEQAVQLKNEIFKGFNKNQRKQITEALTGISSDMVTMDVGKVAKMLGKTPKITQAAQDLRLWYDRVFSEQNSARIRRGQDIIDYRKSYSPEKIRDATIFEEAWPWNKTPEDVMGLKGPAPLPDGFQPSKTYTPHELQKMGNIPIEMLEKDAMVLAERYANAAYRDIFHNDIIFNNRSFARELKALGYPNSAETIGNWTSRSFAGVRGGIDQAFHVGPRLTQHMRRFNQGLNMGIFPGNIAWNLTIQPLSTAASIARHGVVNSAKGFVSWFADTKVRTAVKDSYAFGAKIRGKLTRQDVAAMNEAVKVSKRPLETAYDAFNYFTNEVERQLSGISGSAAYYEAKRLGLKGDAASNFISDGIAKSQSMYDLPGMPAILQNQVIKTTFPFHTFSFEMWNNWMEIRGVTGTPKATFAKRAKQGLTFFAAMTAGNMATQELTGRKPWELSSFVPVYSMLNGYLVEPTIAIATKRYTPPKTRGLTPAAGIIGEGGAAFYHLIETGKWDQVRRWTTKNSTVLLNMGTFGKGTIPGGLQINRLIDGYINAGKGGLYKGDELVIPLTDNKSKIQSAFAGAWTTEVGQEKAKKFRRGLKVIPPGIYDIPGVGSIPVLSDIFLEGEESAEAKLKKLYGK